MRTGTHKLDTASLDTARLTSGSIGVDSIAMLFGEIAIIPGVGKDQDGDGSCILGG